jgi:hypothetical protein
MSRASELTNTLQAPQSPGDGFDKQPIVPIANRWSCTSQPIANEGDDLIRSWT